LIKYRVLNKNNVDYKVVYTNANSSTVYNANSE